MIATIAYLLCGIANIASASEASPDREFDDDLRPACPRPRTAYALRKAGHDDYTVVDGNRAVGHAFRLDGFEPGTSFWTVKAYDVDRDVATLQDAKAWLAGRNPPAV